MSETLEVVRTGEYVTVGRKDYGRGWKAEVVTVAGEEFAVARLRERGATESVERWFTPCGWCDPHWSGSKFYYGHIAEGVCFQCNGAGTRTHRDGEDAAVKLIRSRLRARTRAEAKREEAEARQAAEHRAWVEAHPEVVAALSEVLADRPEPSEGPMTTADYEANDEWTKKWGGDYLTSMALQVQYRPLTERQAEHVVDAVARAKADHEAKAVREAAQRFHGVQGEKVTDAEGTVVVRSTYETFYAGPAELNVLLVITGHGEYEGVTFKVAGKGKTLWDAEKGDTVSLSGKVKRHAVYEGTKQTELNYAKVKVLTSA